jgi:hypothetical protein
MACAQKATSRGVSSTSTPTLALNHCRSASTIETSAISVPAADWAAEAIKSKDVSDAVSSSPKDRITRRRSSSLAGKGAIINF